jgi:Fe-Mn family superoxide dismutase
MKNLTRRELIAATAAAGASTLLDASSFAARQQPGSLSSVVEIPMPSLPEKLMSTESVGIKRATHEAHLKLWQGYAKKTNEIRKALAELTADSSKANQVYSLIRSLKVEYSFAYQGLINHNIYFDTLGGSGGPPTGKAADLIRAGFGSHQVWAEDFKSSGIAARGWVFLAYDHAEKRLFNYVGDSQNTYPLWNHTCILAMDVYEHAYFMDFAEKRAAYIDAYMKVIDWQAVNARLAAAI